MDGVAHVADAGQHVASQHLRGTRGGRGGTCRQASRPGCPAPQPPLGQPLVNRGRRRPPAPPRHTHLRQQVEQAVLVHGKPHAPRHAPHGRAAAQPAALVRPHLRLGVLQLLQRRAKVDADGQAPLRPLLDHLALWRFVLGAAPQRAAARVEARLVELQAARVGVVGLGGAGKVKGGHAESCATARLRGMRGVRGRTGSAVRARLSLRAVPARLLSNHGATPPPAAAPQPLGRDGRCPPHTTTAAKPAPLPAGPSPAQGTAWRVMSTCTARSWLRRRSTSRCATPRAVAYHRTSWTNRVSARSAPRRVTGAWGAGGGEGGGPRAQPSGAQARARGRHASPTAPCSVCWARWLCGRAYALSRARSGLPADAIAALRPALARRHTPHTGAPRPAARAGAGLRACRGSKPLKRPRPSGLKHTPHRALMRCRGACGTSITRRIGEARGATVAHGANKSLFMCRRSNQNRDLAPAGHRATDSPAL